MHMQCVYAAQLLTKRGCFHLPEVSLVMLFNVNGGSAVCTHVCACVLVPSVIQGSRYVYL